MVHIVTNIVTCNWYLLGYQFRTQGYLVMPVSGLATSHVIKVWLQSFHVLALICSSFVCNNSWHTCVCSAHPSKCTILTWFHRFSTCKCTWHLSVRTLWYHSLRHQTGNLKIIFDSSLHFAREREKFRVLSIRALLTRVLQLLRQVWTKCPEWKMILRQVLDDISPYVEKSTISLHPDETCNRSFYHL